MKIFYIQKSCISLVFISFCSGLKAYHPEPKMLKRKCREYYRSEMPCSSSCFIFAVSLFPKKICYYFVTKMNLCIQNKTFMEA